MAAMRRAWLPVGPPTRSRNRSTAADAGEATGSLTPATIQVWATLRELNACVPTGTPSDERTSPPDSE